ncbi:hypothetical protein TNCV_2825071 [Trichonephila clavipes]|nr:hypothetical protein TNCV_2825071 [Trichonephila clavipes]
MCLERRRRIPFDFQRTSLVGLALDSATSSVASGEPRSAMQDPIQAPPELQDRRDYTPADRAARTCWLGCPELLYYPGGLRRKTQLSPVPYMAASSKTPPY